MMKTLVIFLLALVALFAFSGPGTARDEQPNHTNICNDAFVIGNVTHFNELTQTAIVALRDGREVTLNFEHSAVGVCRGVQNNEFVSTLPGVGDSVALRASSECERCLETC